MIRRARRLLALVAAYAVALQALLSGLSVPLQAVGLDSDRSAICARGTDHDAGPGRPAGHDSSCPCGPFCTMPGCATPAAPVGAAFLVAPLIEGHLVAQGADPARIDPRPTLGPHAARAPPA